MRPAEGDFQMTFRRTLLGGAGLAALALTAAPALAAPPSQADNASVNAQLLEEIQKLRDQVEDLSGRLSVQEAAQRETVAGISNAQADAATAKTQVATFTKDAGTKWYSNTSISGRMYFNASNITQKSDGKTVGKSTAFDIKRFYFGVDHKFNNIFSANLTTDVSLISNNFSSAGTTAAGATGTAFPKTVGETLYIKKAYLQASLSKAINFRAGAADLPWVPFDEDLYGYRFVENTLIDRTGFGTSADWGVHAFGTLAGGHITYAIAAIDGAGYRNPLRSKTIDFEGRIAANYKGFTAAVGGYTGKRGANTDNPYTPANPAAAATPVPLQLDTNVNTLHTAQRFDALVAYVSPRFRLGGEYFYAKNWNRVTSVTEDTSEGYSGWGSVYFAKQFSLFGRYDHVRPSKHLGVPELKESYFNAGLNWEPVKIVDLALVYKRDRVANGYFSPSNANPSNAAFAIGGRDHGSYDEIGIFGQFRF